MENRGFAARRLPAAAPTTTSWAHRGLDKAPPVCYACEPMAERRSPAALQARRLRDRLKARRRSFGAALTDEQVGRLQGEVLATLRQTGNLVEACTGVRIHLPIVRGWMSAGPEFRQLVEQAKEQGRQHRVEELELLLDKAARRAPKSMHGVKAAVARLSALDARYRQRGPEINVTGDLVLLQEIRAMPDADRREFLARHARALPANGDAKPEQAEVPAEATIPAEAPCS